MIKEYFIAIILGAILGLGITGGYFVYHQNNNKQNNTEVSPTPTSTQMSTQISVTPSVSENESSINVTSPENNSVISTTKTNIKGNTKPNSLIIISTPSKTFSDKSNSNGAFNISVELDNGINPIKISSIDQDDNQDETEITLTYSTTKI
jgi:cytoskeletal protein RodZ